MHGFPAQLTSFVGRAGAVREVAELLAEYRLVTVTGPGGAGKTRLADQVARQVATGFADGVWLAELASAGDPTQVPSLVAVALGVRDQSGEPLVGTLARVLARQQLLLVLDNCEHVVGAVAALCAALLTAADDVRILTTSREPLRAAGEARYRLGPLTLPDAASAEAAGSEAVTLFAARARQVDPSFALNDQTGPTVARLVARLDGMPLAIELAAAWVEALGVAQLTDRLDEQFDLQTAGDRLAPARHRSLAATVEWSYRLLDEHEQRVFRAVSVFPGPFTPEAAEAVAGPGAGATLLHLVDCSLLVPPRAGPDGRSRYSMLETLRAYGARLLAGTEEQDKVAVALARWAVKAAEEASANLQSFDRELDAATWLDAEHATMRQVLAWSMERDKPAALRLAVALAHWWFLRGRLPGEYLLLREATARAEPGSNHWCYAQYWLGHAAQWAGDLASSLRHFTELRDTGASRAWGRTLADGLAGRSLTLRELGRYVEAADEARSALTVAREAGYPIGEVQALRSLSAVAVQVGDMDGALTAARQATQITAGVPRWVIRISTFTLIRALVAAGDPTAADPICADALSQARGAGALRSQAHLLTKMVILDLDARRLQDAAAHLRESLQLCTRTGSWLDLYDDLDHCGLLCAATGRHAEAITVWAAMAAHKRHDKIPDPPFDARRREKPLSHAQRALGPARTRTAEDRGAAMSLDTVAEYALMLTDLRPPRSAPGVEKLSARERELVTLVAQGRTNAQIAAQLYISVRTVSSHLDRIRDKTGCRRRSDLTRLALTAGLV